MNQVIRKKVYNLKFPSWCPNIGVFGYQFNRVEDYGDRIAELQHLAGMSSEFNLSANTGTHAITAFVEIPEKEKKAVFGWSDPESTALKDILVLLSIFTGRDVFVEDIEHESDSKVIVSDSRVFPWGGEFIVSIPYKEKSIEKSSSLVTRVDIGFEQELNRVYTLIRSESWRKKYQNGYFLLLVRQVFKTWLLESAFTLSWTIWEHLFAILNEPWLPRKQARRSIRNEDKIAFILVEYELVDELSESNMKYVREKLVYLRNQIVHFGRFQEDEDKKYAKLFVRLTEILTAKILDMTPKNTLNTLDRLDEFLKGKY